MTPADDVLAAFVKRFGPRPQSSPGCYEALAEWHPWMLKFEGYRAGHADCAAQESKDREDAERYRQARTMPWVLNYGRITPLRPDKFDSIVDAARKATK